MARTRVAEEKVRETKKRRIMEAALMKWMVQCSPSALEIDLLSEIAFEENFPDLAKQVEKA